MRDGIGPRTGRRALLKGAGGLGLALALAVSATGQTRAAPAKVTFAYTAVSAFAAAFVAKDQGFFEKRGLDVTMLQVANGGVAISSLVADSAQVAGPTPAIFLQAVEGGIPLRVLAGTELIPGSSKTGLIAGNETGITSAKDLAGRRVGVPGIGGLLDVVLRKWIADKGGDPKRTTFIEAAFPQQTDLLKARQVDAVASVDPFYTRTITAGVGTLVADYTETLPKDTISTIYVVSSDWAGRNSAQAAAFREALKDATAFIATHEAETRESLVSNLKLPAPIVAATALPRLDVSVSPEQIQFWVDLAVAQTIITRPMKAVDLLVP